MPGQMARRRIVWICGTLCALALGLSIDRALAADAVSTFAVGVIAQLALAIVAWSAMRGPTGWDGALHSRARWRTLIALRGIAVILLFATIASAAAASLLGTEMPAILPTVAYGSAAASALGWVIEHRPLRSVAAPTRQPPPMILPRAPPPIYRPRQSRRHTLYKTRGGAVLAVDAPGGRDLVFTGRTNVARLSEVEKAIDARGWSEAETPTPRKLRDALARWGTIEEVDP